MLWNTFTFAVHSMVISESLLGQSRLIFHLFWVSTQPVCRFKPWLLSLFVRERQWHRPQPGFPTGHSSVGCRWGVMRAEAVTHEDGWRPLGWFDLGNKRPWALRTGERFGHQNYFQTLENLSCERGIRLGLVTGGQTTGRKCLGDRYCTTMKNNL